MTIPNWQFPIGYEVVLVTSNIGGLSFAFWYNMLEVLFLIKFFLILLNKKHL